MNITLCEFIRASIPMQILLSQKPLNSLLVVGVGRFKLLSTLCPVEDIPVDITAWPKNSNLVWKNLHLASFGDFSLNPKFLKSGQYIL